MSQFCTFTDLPEEFREPLKALEDFVSDMDGKDTVIWQQGHEECIDDGTADAEDAVKAFNALVGAIRTAIPR